MFNRKPPFIPVHPNENVGEPVPLGKSRSNHWSEKSIEKWNANDFMHYFHSRYEKMFGYKYSSNLRADSGMLSKLRKSINDNARMKLLMDMYFDLGYYTVGVEHFVKSTRQNELNMFLSNGTQPPFTKFRPTVSSDVDVVKPTQTKRALEDFFGGK